MKGDQFLRIQNQHQTNSFSQQGHTKSKKTLKKQIKHRRKQLKQSSLDHIFCNLNDLIHSKDTYNQEESTVIQLLKDSIQTSSYIFQKAIENYEFATQTFRSLDKKKLLSQDQTTVRQNIASIKQAMSTIQRDTLWLRLKSISKIIHSSPNLSRSNLTKNLQKEIESCLKIRDKILKIGEKILNRWEFTTLIDQSKLIQANSSLFKSLKTLYEDISTKKADPIKVNHTYKLDDQLFLGKTLRLNCLIHQLGDPCT